MPGTPFDETLDGASLAGEATPAGDADLAPLAERYDDRGVIGRGGMGEVRRVYDRKLACHVAMKVLGARLIDDEHGRARFIAEATTTAGLQHPGIIPVHDRGELPDGRLWFTMTEVRGRTFTDAIAAAHRDGLHALGLRRLVDDLHRACTAVAYAHSHGVLHRDLKPDNLMLGSFGEVYVMDWGLARRSEDHELPGAGAVSGVGTVLGSVLGTVAYMSPEQARGELDSLTPATDVYGLGGVLYEILRGRHPLTGTVARALTQLRTGTVRLFPPPDRSPPALRAICRRAMAFDPAARYPDASALAAAIRGWLDGEERRAQAESVLETATAMRAALEGTEAEVATVRARAAALLQGVPPHAAVADKEPGWDLEDRADDLAGRGRIEEVQWLQTVRSALNIDPDLPGAHDALASYYRRKLELAEATHSPEARGYEVLLRDHDRGTHQAFLRGEGTFTLLTDPPGARVEVLRFVRRRRRLQAERVAEHGPTPIVDMHLPHGSYLLVLRAAGCADVRLPMRIDRGDHTCWMPPGTRADQPVHLPSASAMSPEEVYVPGGWFVAGGDDDALDSLPRRRLWADGFVMRRFAVSHREYLAFVRDTTSRHAPAVEDGSTQPDPRYLDPTGFTEDELETPVTRVDWHGAVAFAAWLADRSGLPWRLPHDHEWEKAARGVDGRLFPFGNELDPVFCCMSRSHPADPRLPVRTAFPLDASPYGIRGLAGHVREWCANPFTEDGPRGPRVPVEAPVEGEWQMIRGGCWAASASQCRAAARFASVATRRVRVVGLRVVRSLG